MSYLKENKNTIVYTTAILSLAVLGSGIIYYLVEDDKNVKRRKEAKRSQRTALRLLSQMTQEEILPIAAKIKLVEESIEDAMCDDKTFKLKEYTLAHSNELLLRLMEKLDAIVPLSTILGDAEKEATPFEHDLVATLKNKKREVIQSIEALFRRLDAANEKAKKESLRREEEAKKRALVEQQEAERKALEEQKLEELRKENERKAKEEQERLAQEEALRRKQEEEEAEKIAAAAAEEKKADDEEAVVVEQVVEEKEVEKVSEEKKDDEDLVVLATTQHLIVNAQEEIDSSTELIEEVQESVIEEKLESSIGEQPILQLN